MIRGLLEQAGFTGSFLLPIKPYTEWVRRRQAGVFHPNTGFLTDDIRVAYPWANAWALCFLAYAPNGCDAPVSSNYIVANTLYHLTERFVKTCTEHGVRAERADVPIRTMAAAAGVGTVLKNAQMCIPPYGSRVSLQAVVLDAGEAPVFDVPQKIENTCKNCNVCENVCPTGAIDGDGFHWQKCARAYMDSAADMPAWARDAVTQLLGCEKCQNACPQNAHLAVQPLSIEDADALDLSRLLSGDVKPAKQILGRNMSRRKLLTQAAIVAGNTGRLDLLPLLGRLCADADEMVARCAEDAISRLQDAAKACTMGASHQTGS